MRGLAGQTGRTGSSIAETIAALSWQQGASTSSLDGSSLTPADTFDPSFTESNYVLAAHSGPAGITEFAGKENWSPMRIREAQKDDRNFLGDALDWTMDTLTGHEIQDHAGSVLSAADQAGIDPRTLLAVLAHESDGRQRFGASRLDHANILLGRGSIGMGQMQRETFVQTAVKHPEVLGRQVTEAEARNEWPRLRDHDELAIRAAAFHLKDLHDALPAGMSKADRHRMAAVGYNIGEAKMLKQARDGHLGYEESKTYAETFEQRFEEADRFFCESDRFDCTSR